MLSIAVRPPFSFQHTLHFLDEFAPTRGEEQLGLSLRKATRLNGQTVGVEVSETADGLALRVFPEQPLSAAATTQLSERLAFFLAAEVDLAPFYALAKQDQPMWAVVQQLYGFHQPRFFTPFEAACWAVIHQRQPLALSRQMKLALCQQAGGHWAGLPAFPEPADLAAFDLPAFQAIVGNERKARALYEVTQAFQGVTTSQLAKQPTAQLRAWLEQIYGIGEWSALFIAVRGLGHLQDIRVEDPSSPFLKEMLKAAAALYGALTPAQLWDLVERYGEQQGLWSIYLRSWPVLQRERTTRAPKEPVL